MDITTLRIEYKKFNTFLFDYLRTMCNGWLFMKMKHKYSIGTELHFQMNIAEIDEIILMKTGVIYHGQNHEGKDGIGLKIDFEQKSKTKLNTEIHRVCISKYGEVWGNKILELINQE